MSRVLHRQEVPIASFALHGTQALRPEVKNTDVPWSDMQQRGNVGAVHTSRTRYEPRIAVMPPLALALIPSSRPRVSSAVARQTGRRDSDGR